jgi:hypothetical protein
MKLAAFEIGSPTACHYGISIPGETNSWELAEIAVWCRQTFGLPQLDPNTMTQRWVDGLFNSTLFFQNEADRNLFIMKWSS